MKFSNVKEMFGRIAKRFTSPKTVAAFGVAAALFQLCLAIEELRSSDDEDED